MASTVSRLTKMGKLFPRYFVLPRTLNVMFSTATIPHPPSDDNKVYSDHVIKLVTDISKLNLLEVADLNQLLKKTLNIQDTPIFGAMPAMAAPAPPEEEQITASAIKTSFAVKLVKFDDAKKVALIKEIKSIMEGFNLVQAKKFIEGAPQIVKSDLSKDEAEKLQKFLEDAGATCELV